MTPVFQTILDHDPAAGRYGDCHRAAIATVLGLPIESVPHFGAGGPPTDEFWRRERQFLSGFGLLGAQCAYAGEMADVLHTVSTLNGLDIVYLLGGLSRRGNDHTVVCRGNRIIHDPHPDASGLVGPCSDGMWWVTYFVAIDLPDLARRAEAAA